MPNRNVVRATDLYNMMFFYLFLFGFDESMMCYLFDIGHLEEVDRFVFIVIMRRWGGGDNISIARELGETNHFAVPR